MTPSPRAPWEKSVGFLPWKVTVYENVQRNGVLYLRWRQDGNWRKESLRRPLRTPRGRIDPPTQQWAEERASAKYATLIAGHSPAEVAPGRRLTIAEGRTRVIDPATGKHAADSAHRREVLRELDRAIAVWGADTPWESIRKADLRRLWRWRIQQLRAEEHTGLRGAEITIARVLAVAAWLRDEEAIPAGACVAPRHWKRELADDWSALTGQSSVPAPGRPRHTLDEMRRIIAASASVDPRLALALALGAELRLGQVLRCRRTDLDLEHRTLTVRGARQKRGVVVKLTDGQMRAVDRALGANGYLRELEAACADYPLFPAGQMPGGRSGRPVATVKRHATGAAVDRSVLDAWFREAEEVAEVSHQAGRGAYGLRRAAVDAVKAAKISREGLMAHGGWTDTQVPDRVYAEQNAEYARDEARAVRAKIRGEGE